MEKLKVSKYPLLVKVILFYLFIKVADGFLSALGAVLFKNTSPVLKVHLTNSLANLTWFYQWLTTTEIKISPIGAIFCIIGLYLIYRVSSKFV